MNGEHIEPERFQKWRRATVAKWLLLIVSSSCIRTFPTPIWISLSQMVVLFGHLAAEFLFPGGWRALYAAGQKGLYGYFNWFVAFLSAATLLFFALFVMAAKHQWLPLDTLRPFVFAPLLAVAGTWTFFMVFHDVVTIRCWPREHRQG